MTVYIVSYDTGDSTHVQCVCESHAEAENIVKLLLRLRDWTDEKDYYITPHVIATVETYRD